MVMMRMMMMMLMLVPGLVLWSWALGVSGGRGGIVRCGMRSSPLFMIEPDFVSGPRKPRKQTLS
eukprot:9393621-Karenia_brevis.AAC.1